MGHYHWRIYQHGVSATATPLRTEVIAEIFCISLINICTKELILQSRNLSEDVVFVRQSSTPWLVKLNGECGDKYKKDISHYFH
jgi:hypothetical protein